MTGINHVQNPGGNWSSEVLMKRRHCTRFDRTSKSGPHDEFKSLMKFFNKGFQIPEVIGAVAIPHNHVLAANKRKSINVSASQSSFRSFEDSGSLLDGNLRSLIG